MIEQTHPIKPFPGNPLLKALHRVNGAFRSAKNHNKNGSQIYIPNHTLSENSPPQSFSISGRSTQIDYLKNEVFRGYDQFPQLQIYVHGSWADDTNNGFSDIDDLVIIDYENITSSREAKDIANWLNKVDMRFCRIDPIQHHGHWIISQQMLQNYDNSYIPLHILTSAIKIQGPSKISARVCNQTTARGLSRNIRGTVAHATSLYEKYMRCEVNAYEMKQLIGDILILPAYVAQYQTLNWCKRTAIESAAKLFEADALECLSIASEIRGQWELTTRHPTFDRLWSASKVISNPHLMREFSRRFAPKFVDSDYPTIDSNTFQAFLHQCLSVCDKTTE